MKKLILICVGIATLNLISVVGVRSFQIAAPTTAGISFADTLRRNSKMAGGVWCWLDICPGMTRVEEARSKLLPFKLIRDYASELQVEAEDGVYTFVTNPRGNTGIIDTIVFEPDQQTMTLADSVLQFGTPISVQEEAEIGYSWHRAICLQSGVCAMVHGFGPRVAMQSIVVSISYHSSNAQAYAYGYRPWNGFALLPPG